MKNERDFERWMVSKPCTVKWAGHQVDGEIANISFGGALVIQMEDAPPKDTEVVLTVQVENAELELVSSVTSRVVRSSLSVPPVPDGQVAWMGVQFLEDLEEVRTKLHPILPDLLETLLSSDSSQPGASCAS